MRFNSLILFLIFFSGHLLVPILSHPTVAKAEQSSTEEEAVRACFQAYRTAILEGKGEVAVQYISQKTLDYYAEIRELALYQDAPRVMALDLMDRLMILSLRHRVGATRLQKMDAKQLFVYSVQNGWIGKDGIQRLRLAEITLEPRTAKAAYTFDGKETGLYLLFYKQHNAWSLDLTNVLRTGNAALVDALRQEGRDENEFIFNAIASVTGSRPPQSIWHPPLYRK